MKNRLRKGGIVNETVSALIHILPSILQDDGRKGCRVIYEFSCSAKLSTNVP